MHDLIKNGAKGARRFKRSTWVLALLVLAVIPLVAGFMGSLGKSELGERLAALDKNAAIGELERLDFVGDVGGGPRDLGLVYHHAPRTNGPGPEGAIPILLIHGTPSTLYSWSELIHGAEESSEGPASRAWLRATKSMRSRSSAMGLPLTIWRLTHLRAAHNSWVRRSAPWVLSACT